MQRHPEASANQSAPAKPFLKWSGGKQRLLAQLLPFLPPGKRLIEPFVGAGSVFLASDYDAYVLNDANPELVATWVAVKERPREFIERASAFFRPEFHSQQAYLQVRAEFNELVDRFERAVRLPYLNRFGFNGLFRVNRKGEFNVPYGSPTALPHFDIQRYEAATDKLTRCLVINGGFAGAIELAGVGDVVYCDPPYLDSAAGESFTSYTATGFSLADHIQLLECCLQAVSRGAKVVISNHDTPQTRDLYKGWQIAELSARRSVSSNASSRGIAREIVAMLPQPI